MPRCLQRGSLPGEVSNSGVRCPSPQLLSSGLGQDLSDSSSGCKITEITDDTPDTPDRPATPVPAIMSVLIANFVSLCRSRRILSSSLGQNSCGCRRHAMGSLCWVSDLTGVVQDPLAVWQCFSLPGRTSWPLSCCSGLKTSCQFRDVSRNARKRGRCPKQRRCAQ